MPGAQIILGLDAQRALTDKSGSAEIRHVDISWRRELSSLMSTSERAFPILYSIFDLGGYSVSTKSPPGVLSSRMDTVDRVMYAGCWVVLALYILTTLLVFTQRSCISCTASFVFACLLWLDLTVFNAWFFVPAFIYHIRDIDLYAGSLFGVLWAISTSEAAQDVYLMMLGSFGSWLAVFNAASMLSTEGCVAVSPHGHGKLTRRVIESGYRLRDYLGFEDDSAVTLPTTNIVDINPKENHQVFTDP
ncbi:hypothetical protein GGR51DRAFT_572149 [Nemania sp. FL0031]|nr:hypothetical protein GGR51DRAFT_572149 [Nemania sp. FL0031]